MSTFDNYAEKKTFCCSNIHKISPQLLYVEQITVVLETFNCNDH